MNKNKRITLTIIAALALFLSSCGMPASDRQKAKVQAIEFRDADYEKLSETALKVMDLSVDMFDSLDWKGGAVIIAKDDLVRELRYFIKGNGGSPESIRAKAEVLLDLL